MWPFSRSSRDNLRLKESLDASNQEVVSLHRTVKSQGALIGAHHMNYAMVVYECTHLERVVHDLRAQLSNSTVTPEC
jgi:hypothetical protein